jgi:uncharacterized protein YbjQ (UPF0145 family)
MDYKILITTQDNFSEFKIEKTLGLVRGNTVRSRNIARNLIASFRTIFGGEIPEFTKAVAESREQALDRMIEHAAEMGADAVVAVRFITAEVDTSCSEIMVYGTAVKLQK